MQKPRSLPDAAFVREDEIAALCRLSGSAWGIVRQRLERSGFPKPDPVVGMYWSPAVRAFFDRRHGVCHAHAEPALAETAGTPDGVERW